jgi:hypothetical protein
MEDRVRVGEGVIAGMVAERSFETPLVWIDVAFKDDLGVCRNFKIDSLALDEVDRLPPKKPGEHQLIDLIGEWS